MTESGSRFFPSSILFLKKRRLANVRRVLRSALVGLFIGLLSQCAKNTTVLPSTSDGGNEAGASGQIEQSRAEADSPLHASTNVENVGPDSHPPWRVGPPLPPASVWDAAPAPGRLRLSEDAGAKSGDFWLEQPIWFQPLRSPFERTVVDEAGQAATDLAHLWLAYCKKKNGGVRLRLTTRELLFEQTDELAGKWQILAQIAPGEVFRKVPPPASAPLPVSVGQYAAKDKVNGYLSSGSFRAWPTMPGIFGVLRRGGEISVWWDDLRLLTWRGRVDVSGASAAEAKSAEALLGPRRVVALGSGMIHFSDDFMRLGDEESGTAWRSAGGRWELSAVSFPDRTANPFALCARFDPRSKEAERLQRGRIRSQRVGLGFEMAMHGDFPMIARITGGSPAARAGLKENDIILALDGISAAGQNAWQIWRNLNEGKNTGESPIRLSVVHPDDQAAREVTLRRSEFRWGLTVENEPLPPETEATEGFILAGDSGWSDYTAAVSVKPLGAVDFGLAVAVLSTADCLLFRRLAVKKNPFSPSASEPAEADDEADFPPNAVERLQLVRLCGGKETVLAERPWRFRPYEFCRLRLSWLGEQVRASVDEREVFRTNVSGLRRGQIALYASRGEAVYFDDVEVRSTAPALFSPATAPTAGELAGGKHLPVFSEEADMAAWADPAKDWRRHERSPWAYYNFPLPGRQSLTLSRPRFASLAVRFHDETPFFVTPSEIEDQRRNDAVFAPPPDPQTPPTFLLSDGRLTLHAGNGRKTLELPVGDGPYRSVVLREDRRGLPEAEIDGRTFGYPREIEPVGGGEAALRRGCGLAVKGLLNLGAPDAARAASSGLLEYVFDRAPVDWIVSSGRWGLLNKWICDPRWSWFGGRTAAVATLWSKHAFAGDLTFEAYAAPMMLREEPPHERAADLGLVFCAQAGETDSGYALWCGGGPHGGNRWTRLYRKGRIVAETTLAAARFPSDNLHRPLKPELHQRWFPLRVEKRHDRIRFFFDGRAVLEWRDPEPLSGGHLGFFVQRNGFLLARVRIAADERQRPELPAYRAEAYDDGAMINAFDGEFLTHVRRETLPPEIAEALAAPPDQFRPASAPAVAEERLAAGAAGDAGAFGWRVENCASGGALALQSKTLIFDPENMSHLRFAYRVPPAEQKGARVDLLLLEILPDDGFNPERSRAFRLRMTGPEKSEESAPILGDVPDFKADGRWHAVQMDLRPLWRKFWRERGFRRPGNVMVRPAFGNAADGDGLMVGLNGNGGGAHYAVAGLHAFDARTTDHRAPRLRRMIFPFDEDGDGRSLRLTFEDSPETEANAPVSGFDEHSLRLSVNRRPLKFEEFDYDPITGTVTVNLARLRLTGERAPNDPQGVWKMNVTIHSFADTAKNAHQEALERVWTFTAEDVKRWVARRQTTSPGADLSDPPSLFLTVGGVALPEAVNAPLTVADVKPLRGVSPARLEPEEANGEGVRVMAIEDGSSFGFSMAKVGKLNLLRYPFLELVARIGAEAPVNVSFGDDQNRKTALPLTDRAVPNEHHANNFATRLAVPADFSPDERMRRYVFPLGVISAAAMPIARPWVQNVEFSDLGWPGNRRGMNYAVRTARFLPAVRGEDIAFRWSEAHWPPTEAIATAVDESPNTEPTAEFIGERETLAQAIARHRVALRSGWKWFHLRRRLPGGYWTPTVHYPFYLDQTAPVVVRTEPSGGQDGGTAPIRGAKLRIFIREDVIVDHHALRIKLNGSEYAPGVPGVSFDAAANVLTFDGAMLVNPFRPQAGQTLAFELTGLRDGAGNEAPVARWMFQHAPASAAPGPRILRARFTSTGTMPTHFPPDVTAELSWALDFEHTLGQVRPLRDCRLEWTADPAAAAYGARAVKAIGLSDGGGMSLRLHESAFSLRRRPLLQFDYKAEPGAAVDLLVETFGRHYTIQMFGDGKGPNPRGVIADLTADGRWRRAAVDLNRFLAADATGWPLDAVSKLTLGVGEAEREGNASLCRRGAAIWLDNVELMSAFGAGGRLEWETEDDPVGLQGWSVCLDDKPDTIPPPTISTNVPRFGAGGLPGVFWIHIRACNQAGNWGPAFHYRLDCGG